MPIWFQSLVVLFLVWIVARVIKRNILALQNFFIPSSLIGGVLLLFIGYQGAEIIPKSISQWLNILPGILINVVFATMFIGHKHPTTKKIWKQAGPMIAFGNTIAWGMYALGAGLTLLILQPVFGASPAFGAILEVSFSGGHGTAAGLSRTFAQLGWHDATDIAFGLATLSIIVAVISGITIINIYNRRARRVIDRVSMDVQRRRMIRRGYDLMRFSKDVESHPRDFTIAGLVIGSAIGTGWLLQQGLSQLENALLAPYTSVRVLAYVPLFSLAMFGGLIVHIVLDKLQLLRFVRVRTLQTLNAIALDLLIITAIGTMSLSVIEHNFAPFILLALAGISWILFAFFVLAPKFFHKHWFEFGLTDMGQAMGMTATGLLLNRLVDPLNRTGARESFAYKQLAYEPFMGGGILTVFTVVMIGEVGLLPVGIATFIICLLWLGIGLAMGRRRTRRRKRQHNIAHYAMRAS